MEMCIRQLLVKSNKSNSWFIYAKSILDLYQVTSVYSLISDIPSARVWKSLVRPNIYKYWKAIINEGASSKSSLQYLNRPLSPGDTHTIWISAGTDSISIKKACAKARLVTGVYVLQKDRSKFFGSREKPECVLCKDGDEDRNHFILKCRTLDNVRTVFMTKLKDILLKLDMYDYILGNCLLLQLILDLTHPSIPMKLQGDDVRCKIESISRGLCIALHRERCFLLDIQIK